MYRKNLIFFLLVYKRTWPGPGGVVFCRGLGLFGLDERRKLTQKGLAFWAVVGRVTDKQ